MSGIEIGVAVLCAMLPVCALSVAWFLKRAIAGYDEAQHERQAMKDKLDGERQERIDRHTNRNHSAIVKLSADLLKSNKELNNQLVEVAEKTSEAVSAVNVRLARIEGRQEAWDGNDRRTG